MKLKISFLTLTLAIFLLSGCKDYLDVNTDPNNPATVSSDLILPSAEAHIASIVNGSYGPLGGIWAQHWTQSHKASQYKVIDRYNLKKTDYNTAWRDLYSDALIDLETIRKDAVATGNWNLNLQAVSLEVYIYQTLADWYDKIPFSQAAQGKDAPTPAFDNGEDVYSGMITMLDDALSKDFSSDGNAWIRTDFVFGSSKAGQISNWQKFANTLKLKIFLRESGARNDVAQTGIKAMFDNGARFLTNTDAKMAIYTDADAQSYPLYESQIRQLNVGTNLRASNTLVSFLDQNADPRIDAYFTAGSGGHLGLLQGDFDNTDYSGGQVDVAIFSPTRPFYFFTKDEVNFMLAEASMKYNSGTDTKAYYDQAVMDAFSRYGFDGSTFVAAGGTYEFPNGSQADNMQAIIMQKWASSVDRGLEAFFDQNRTGIPKISAVPGDDANYVPGEFTYSKGGVTGGAFPKRLIYPDVTRRANPNTPAEVDLTVKVWWAQ